MAYRGWLSLGGIELANNARVFAYAEHGGTAPGVEVLARGVPELFHRVLQERAYRLPALDTAPWFDPDDPVSAEFSGLLVLSVDGLDAAEVVRAFTDGIGDGGVPGIERFKARTITVTGTLLAQSAAGLAYGVSWLSSALRGSLCADGTGDQLCYLAAPPDVCEEDTDADVDAQFGELSRTLHDVALTSSPSITSRGGVVDVGATYAGVTFTLTAGVPQAYRSPRTVVTSATWPTASSSVPDPTCPQPAPLLRDPLLPVITLPTYPTSTTAPAATYRRLYVDVPRSVVPEWTELIPVVSIRAGGDQLRGVRVRFLSNPLQLPASSPTLLCSVCTDTRVSYVPSSTTLVLDGVTGRATAQALGGEVVPAGAVVSSPTGGPWELPVLSCGTDYVMVVDVAAASNVAGASVELQLVPRDV